MSTIEEIVRIVEQGGYDLIVGFGGGSPIDVAKAAAVLPHTGDTVYDYVGIDQVKKKGLPIIAIPTTAGTGSECTAIAIFANEKLNVKQGLVSPYLMPNVALIDPALTLSCPPSVTAASGMDALIHNIEAYISVNATMHTDSLAFEGIKLISQSIRTAVYDGSNMWARDNMAMGSMMGGIAFGNAGVGAVHALSYPIGGMFHVPHGVANTMVISVLERRAEIGLRRALGGFAGMGLWSFNLSFLPGAFGGEGRHHWLEARLLPRLWLDPSLHVPDASYLQLLLGERFSMPELSNPA
jgi:alcohol dehydrogenase